MKKILITLFTAMSLYMIYVTITTSLASNLFKEWGFLSSLPWMRATLIDFYLNTILIGVWMYFREKAALNRMLWFISFVLLGSITTSLYVVVQLVRLGDDEPVSNAFLIKSN